MKAMHVRTEHRCAMCAAHVRMYSWRAYRRRCSACARTTNTACAFVCVYGRNEDQSEGLASRPVRKPAKKPPSTAGEKPLL